MNQLSVVFRWCFYALFPLLGLTVSALAHQHPETKADQGVQPAEQSVSRRPQQSPAQAWTAQPVLLVAGRPEGGVTPLAAKGLVSDQMTVFSPDGKQAPQRLAKENGRWSARPLEAGVGGYHWLSSRSASATEIRSAATVVMFPSKGPSPAHLLTDYQMGLDIRPVRLPERGGFREETEWSFLLRFDGLPVAKEELLVETENGTQRKFSTNSEGVAKVVFPRDFDPETIDKEAGATRTRKGYVVSAAIERDGIQHVSAFNYFYSPDVMRERSLAWGAGFALLGMGLALPLLRRKKEAGNA